MTLLDCRSDENVHQEYREISVRRIQKEDFHTSVNASVMNMHEVSSLADVQLIGRDVHNLYKYHTRALSSARPIRRYSPQPLPRCVMFRANKRRFTAAVYIIHFSSLIS
ncbi:uncharacterized protein V6R79_011544 [Siganus canaliculatus]